MKKLLITVVVTLAVLALAPAAKADSVSVGPGCTNCNGNVVTLTITGNTITLTINTSGATNVGNAVAAVDFTIPGLAWSNVTLTGAPGGTGNWISAFGPANAGGCGGVNGSTVCAEATNYDAGGSAPAGAIVNGSNMVWTWTIGNGSFNASSATHIGVVWDQVQSGNYTGKPPAGIISEGLAVPEPGTIALLGCGLLGLAALRRRLL